MNKLIIAALAVLLAYTWAITAGEILIPLPEEEVRRQFKLFLHKFEKVYSVDESQYKQRLAIFTKNLEKIRYLNHIHNETIYGINKFADLDETEFKNMYLSRVPISRPEKLEVGQFIESVPVPNDLPKEWDWTQKGAVTPVKNQGSCGSCWSFSATGNLEGQWFLAGHNLTSFSEQQFVDCDKECDPQDPQSCDAGCNGGLMMNAFRYAIKNGVETEKDYSYEGYDGQCRYDKSKVVAQFTDLKMLPTDEDQIAAYLVEHGPLAVALNANNLQFYMGGISDPFFCNPKALDHGVMIVGFGEGHTITGTKKYWLVKNSWGSGWGEHGYFKLVRGKGKCGINTYVCTALV